MMELSPIFQAEAPKIVPQLDAIVHELHNEREYCDYSADNSRDLQILLNIRDIFNGDVPYDEAVTRHSLSNHVIADILYRYDIIPEAMQQSIKFGAG